MYIISIKHRSTYFDNPEFEYISHDPYYLHLLSLRHDVPTISNLDQLIEYSNMSLNNRLLQAFIIDNLNDINRMIDLCIANVSKYESCFNGAMTEASGENTPI